MSSILDSIIQKKPVQQENAPASGSAPIPGTPAVIPPRPTAIIPSRVSEVTRETLNIIRQGAEAAFDTRMQWKTVETLKNYGTFYPEESSINQTIETDPFTFSWKLKTIENTIKYEDTYHGEKPLAFPEYTDDLRSYLGGRYEVGGDKIRYHRHPEMFVHYTDRPFINEEERRKHIQEQEASMQASAKQVPTKGDQKIQTKVNNVNAPVANRPLAAQPTVKPVEQDTKDPGNPFKYTLSGKTIKILKSLEAIYNYVEKGEQVPAEYLPWKYVKTEVKEVDINGRITKEKRTAKMYIQDTDLKVGTLASFVGNLNIPGLSLLTEQVGKKDGNTSGPSYQEVYLHVDKMKEILDYMLGPHNWSIELSDPIPINDYSAQVVRGYYVDALGNFVYGQIVSDSKIGTAGSKAAGKTDAINSNLIRTLIGDAFAALRGINAKNIPAIEKTQAQIAKARKVEGENAVKQAQREEQENELRRQQFELQKMKFEYLKNLDLPKLMEISKDQPLKLLADIASEPLQGVKRPAKPVEEEEKVEKRLLEQTPEEAELKEMTITKAKGTKEFESKEE